jgi:hypothetical protein
MSQVFLLIFFFCSFLQARVFNMEENTFGGFFNATYGNSSVGKDYFTGESASTEFSKGFDINAGGEFGFIYNTDKVSWLFGLEIFRPFKTKGTATTGSNDDYSYSANISAYAPKVGLELIFYQNTNMRIFANGAVGTGSLNMKNGYSSLTVSPNSDFTIEGKGTANLLTYSLGGEFYVADRTSLILSYGYRQLNFKKIKYLDDVGTSFTGTHSKGEVILKQDGSALGYDFSNYFLTIGLRFWIH